jgi:drug/metabolite transporter (DMT)-like permease
LDSRGSIAPGKLTTGLPLIELRERRDLSARCRRNRHGTIGAAWAFDLGDVTVPVSTSIGFANRRGFAYVILTLTVLFLALNHVIGRAVHTEVPPVGLAFWRWAAALVMLFPFVWRRRRQSLLIIRENLISLTALGCLMIGCTTLLLIALNYTTAINVALVNTTQPALTVLFGSLFFRDKLTPAQAAGIASALVGVAVILVKGDWQTLSALNFNGGDLVAMVGMCGFATYALNIRRIPASLTNVEALFAIIVIGCAALFPFYVFETVMYRPVPLNGTAVAAILTLAVLLSIFGMLMWNVGNQIVGPKRASIFMNLLPVFATILAVLFLGERLHLYHLVGFILVCLGIFLVIGRFRASGAGRTEQA